MLKKTITYENPFTNEPITETFYFHLTMAELVEYDADYEGGLLGLGERLANAKTKKEAIDEFKKLILISYCERSEDGKRPIKSAALREQFVSTEAYSKLFMELGTDTEAGIAFFNGVMPAEVREAVTKELKTTLPTSVPSEPRVLTRAEAAEMDADELTGLLRTGQAVIGSGG